MPEHPAAPQHPRLKPSQEPRSLYPKGALSIAEEDAILARVGATLSLEQSPRRRDRDFSAKTHLSWRWAITLATSAAVLVLWWVWPTQPMLELGGALQTRSLTQAEHSPQASAHVQVTVPLGQQGHLKLPGQWSITARSQTQFQLKRKDKTATLALERGLIQVHVLPGRMTSFKVRSSRGVQIQVKGTRFSVEQHKRWLRVEVWRGRVAVVHPRLPALSLSATQGLRLDTQSFALQHYRIPTTPLTTPSARLMWLLAHEKPQGLQFALDLAQNPRHPAKTREESLYRAASAQGIGIRLRLLNLAYHVQRDPEWRYTAARQCRRSLKTKPSRYPQCLRLYRLFLAHKLAANDERAQLARFEKLKMQLQFTVRRQRGVVRRALRRYLKSRPSPREQQRLGRLLRQYATRLRISPRQILRWLPTHRTLLRQSFLQ